MNLIDEFLKQPEQDFYIPCENERERDSKRTSLFHARRKLPQSIQETIGIRKAEIAGKMFVVLYSRQTNTCYRMVEGVLTPVAVETADADPGNSIERMKKLMREDGMSEKQIEEYFNAKSA